STSFPTDFSEATGRSSVTRKFLSARICNILVPTSPVSPLTATSLFLVVFFFYFLLFGGGPGPRRKKRSLPVAGRLLISCYTKQSKPFPLREHCLDLLGIFNYHDHSGPKVVMKTVFPKFYFVTSSMSKFTRSTNCLILASISA